MLVRIRRPLSLGLLVAGLSFAINLLWVFSIPPLQAPDEPAHLQTIMAVRSGDILPVNHWQAGQLVGPPSDSPVLQYARAQGITTPFMLLPYEFSQPPLYYWVAGTLALPMPPDPAIILYIGRIVAALFGAGAVYFCWAAMRQLAPAHPQWAVAAAATVALLPQFGFNSATAANDSAALCCGMAAFYSWFRALRDPTFDRWGGLMGGICGLAILSKLSGAVLLPGLALVLGLRAAGQARQTGSKRDAWRAALRQAIGAGLALLLLCGPWIIRNLWLYGEPTGTAAMFRFYHGIFGTVQLADATQRQAFAQATWKTSVGVFGWLSVILPQALYSQAGYVVIILLGLSSVAILRRAPLGALLRQAAAIMALVTLTLLASYIQFSVAVSGQPQGRYLFLALLPVALLATAGLYTLPPRGRRRNLALSALLIWLAVLDTTSLALVRYSYDGGDDPYLPPPRTTISRGAVLATLLQRFALPSYQPVGAATFSDVPPADPRFAVAETAHHAGIISGYACGGLNEPCDAARRPALRLDNAVNRRQFAQLLVTAAGWPLRSPVTPTFTDLPAGTVFYPAIETAVYHGALHGYPCGAPGEPCDDQRRPYFRPSFNTRHDDSVAALAVP